MELRTDGNGPARSYCLAWSRGYGQIMFYDTLNDHDGLGLDREAEERDEGKLFKTHGIEGEVHDHITSMLIPSVLFCQLTQGLFRSSI